MASRGGERIDNVYLLGAAVGGGEKDDSCWKTALGAVRGKIFNGFARKDRILSQLYRGANAMLSEPAGYSGIHLRHDKLRNIRCTDFVDGHQNWKSQFDKIIRLSQNES